MPATARDRFDAFNVNQTVNNFVQMIDIKDFQGKIQPGGMGVILAVGDSVTAEDIRSGAGNPLSQIGQKPVPVFRFNMDFNCNPVPVRHIPMNRDFAFSVLKSLNRFTGILMDRDASVFGDNSYDWILPEPGLQHLGVVDKGRYRFLEHGSHRKVPLRNAVYAVWNLFSADGKAPVGLKFGQIRLEQTGNPDYRDPGF